jgi:hypothetical protein
MTTIISTNRFLLTPGCSPVRDGGVKSAVSTASRAAGETVETVLASVCPLNTGLKPGANENCFAPHFC